MKTILKQIFNSKRAYSQLPFFQFLRDDSLPARERLGFFPCMAPFIMSFGDLNRHVLRVEPSIDPHQRIINEHSYEDDHHWPWYLEDLSKLGFDTHAAQSDTLRFLYSDATTCSRMLAHRLAHLLWNATPIVRLAIIEAIEETGNVLFALTARLALQVEREEGIQLRYLGEFHFQLESGHAMNSDHADLAKVTFEQWGRAQASDAVGRVFSWFEDWTGELLRFAQRGCTATAPTLAAA